MDPQMIMRVMGAMRRKLDLCLRRDGEHMWRGTAGTSFLRNELFVVLVLKLFCFNFPKNIGNKFLTINVFIFLTHVKQKFYNIFLKSHCSGTVDRFHLKISSIINKR